MAFYTVMTPPPEGDRREEIEQARLIPESFAWGAFLIPGLWLLGKRLWLATLLVVLVWAVVIYLNSRFGLHVVEVLEHVVDAAPFREDAVARVRAVVHDGAEAHKVLFSNRGCCKPEFPATNAYYIVNA